MLAVIVCTVCALVRACVRAFTRLLMLPWSCRNAGEIRNYPVAVHIDGKCTLKGLTFLSLEAAVDFFSNNVLDGVHLVTSVSACTKDIVCQN